jgi:hypothetical protein
VATKGSRRRRTWCCTSMPHSRPRWWSGQCWRGLFLPDWVGTTISFELSPGANGECRWDSGTKACPRNWSATTPASADGTTSFPAWGATPRTAYGQCGGVPTHPGRRPMTTRDGQRSRHELFDWSRWSKCGARVRPEPTRTGLNCVERRRGDLRKVCLRRSAHLPNLAGIKGQGFESPQLHSCGGGVQRGISAVQRPLGAACS